MQKVEIVSASWIFEIERLSCAKNGDSERVKDLKTLRG